MLEQNSFRVLL